MASVGKIQQLKYTVGQQNEMITNLRKESASVREVVFTLYTNLVKYKPAFQASSSSVDTVDFPEIRAEDLNKLPMVGLIRNLTTVFSTMAGSLEANRTELTALLRELDADVDDVLSNWQQIQLDANQEKRVETFRTTNLPQGAQRRVETPEPTVVPHVSSQGNNALPPTPDSSSDKGNAKQDTSSEPKRPTTTVGKLASLAAGKPKSSPAK